MSKTLEPCPNFIGGEWIDSKTARTPVFNPSIGEVISECPVGNVADANAAVEAAHAAFPAWKETPPVERARILGRFKRLMDENFEDIVRSNTREHGKTLVESRGDVKRGMEVIEFALGVPSLMMGEVLENIARGIDCEAIRQPLGVCVGITPFNFPAMVPLWMYPIAIACGNTFVLKPSEKVPLTAIKIAKLLEKAGLPKGVLNIVHGGREVVDALLTHPKVKAISFVGSTPIARVAADDVLEIFIHQHLEPAKNPRAFDRRRFHPRGKRGVRGLDGGVGVRDISDGTFRNHFADGRIENRCARGCGINPFTADKIRTRFKCV